MLAFFERLATKSRMVREKKLMTWRQLVIDVTDGNEPSEDAVIEALQRLGKTIEDLQDSVALLTKRREWSELARKGAEARLKLNSIESEKAPHVAEFQAAEAKFNLAISEIHERSSQLRLVAGQGDHARIELGRSATDPEIQLTIERCGPRMSELQRRLEEIGEFMNERQGDSLTDIRQQKKDLSAELAELQAEHSGAIARKLIPESIG